MFHGMLCDTNNIFRSLESLVEELVKNGIIIQYPKFFLSEFIGDYNYVGSIQDVDGDSEKDPIPCLRDVRRVVNEFCILPMGNLINYPLLLCTVTKQLTMTVCNFL